MKHIIKLYLLTILFVAIPVLAVDGLAVIDMRTAVLSTQAAADAFKALEEDADYSTNLEEAQSLQAERQAIAEKLQKELETLSQPEITQMQKDIQEKTTDLEFVLGKIQTKQNETIQTVAAQLNPAMMQIINDLIVAKKIQLLLGADQALYFDGSVSITEQVTDALDGAANAEPESN